MPKAYSDNEREYIKKRLMEEAKQCLDQYGVQKTTVDELVKRVNIPKGTFYLFYKSKELLFFDVISDYHDEIQENLIIKVKSKQGAIDADWLTEIIFKYYTDVKDSFLLRFLTNGEMERFMQKLPENLVDIHMEKDDFNLEKLISLLPNLKSNRIKAYSGALRGIFFSMLHQREIGEGIFDDALKIMINGVVSQMFEENVYD